MVNEIDKKVLEYINSETTFRKRDEWLNFFRKLGWYARPHREKFKHPIIVYRGGIGEETKYGLSWTTNKLCAIWFAGRREESWGYTGKKPVVYKATAPPEAVLAYITTDRGSWLRASENEVIVDPALLQNIEAIEPDFSVFNNVKVAGCKNVFCAAYFTWVLRAMLEDKLTHKIKKLLLVKPDIQKILNKYHNYTALEKGMYRIFFKDFYVQFVDDEEESWEDYLEKDCPVLYRAYRRVNDKKNRAGEELKRLIMSYLPDKTEGYILFAWHTIVDSSTPSLNKRYEKILSKYTSIFNNAPAVKEMKELIKEMEEFMETDW